MRANSPLDEIQHFAPFVDLPRPKYPIGTTLNPQRLSKENQSYYWKQVVRGVLRRTRRIVDSLQRQGYMADMKGKKMLEHNKNLIRQVLDMVRYADSVEIAGAQPHGMHVVGSVSNQCYLRNGQSHSGVSYDYFLLFRRRVAENSLVYVHPEALISECYIRDLSPVVPEA